MNLITKIFKFQFLLLIFSPLLFSQSNFNLQDYKNFLESHQNMSAEDLYLLHSANNFLNKINVSTDNSQYYDSICIKYNLTEYEKSLIANYGFMVTERLTKESFGEALQDIFHKDLPIFISSDAILHAFHLSYDRILKNIELNYLIEEVKQLLNNLHSKQNELHLIYNSNPQMLTMLKDVDVYLTVPAKLLKVYDTPFYPENSTVVNELINYIETEEVKHVNLFSEHAKIIDFSQFKPRGHYVDETYPILADYFRTMMWFGRIELYLMAPKSYDTTQTVEDLQRQSIAAFLINELINLSNTKINYDKINSILEFFVGEQDNVTLENLDYLKNAIQLNSPTELLNLEKFQEFQDTLANQTFAYQRILSQILMSAEVDSIVPASAFMLFGQRFIIDSYVFSQVVYDRIKFNGVTIRRMLPNSIDILFALGNDASAQLLKDELEEYKYATNLASLRYLIDHYDNEYWKENIYNYWLNFIRKLNPPNEREQLPQFMQTAAYWQKMMNTQLTSWTQLRHDNLLYAKQSYTGGVVCSYPYVYIEVFPQLYQAMSQYAEDALNRFQALGIISENYFGYTLENYLTNLHNITDTLAKISNKELQKIPLTDEENNFLKNVLYLNPSSICGDPEYLGWYPQLFFNGGSDDEGYLKPDYLVADVHTAPTDESGLFIGWVKHVGTGPINLGVWIAEMADNQSVAFIGPVLNYQEYTTTNFLRLTDQEWKDTYRFSSLRPSFVNVYLADSTGGPKPQGTMLFTSIDDNPPTIVKDYLIAQNYPNPFNSSTIISYTIPQNLNNTQVELKIYDIQGRLIKTLVNDVLSSGNYLTRWDGKNNNGITISSGIYFYRLNAENQFTIGKMSLMK